MAKKALISKKRRGPAPTGVGAPQLVRMNPKLLAEIDKWSGVQDGDLSRPEAIRRLVELGLKAKES